MKITKDTQIVWNLGEGDSLIATSYGNHRYYVRTKKGYIIEYTKVEMEEVYGLTEDQFDNIKHSGI